MAGYEDAQKNPTKLEEKAKEQLEALDNESEQADVEKVDNELVVAKEGTETLDQQSGHPHPPRRRNWVTQAYEEVRAREAHHGPLDKKTWAIKKAYRSMLSWFQRGLRLLSRRAENGQPMPAFFVGV